MSAISLPSAPSPTPVLSHICNRKKRNPGEEIVTSPKMCNLHRSSFSFVFISPCLKELRWAPFPWLMPVGGRRGHAHLPLCSQAQPLIQDTLAQAPPATSPVPLRPSLLPVLPSRGHLSLIFLVKNIYTIIRDFFFLPVILFFWKAAVRGTR